jgi:hypothetical protein
MILSHYFVLFVCILCWVALLSIKIWFDFFGEIWKLSNLQFQNFENFHNKITFGPDFFKNPQKTYGFDHITSKDTTHL